MSSKCRACGLYYSCLLPNNIHCAEREEQLDALDRDTEMQRAHDETEMR